MKPLHTSLQEKSILQRDNASLTVPMVIAYNILLKYHVQTKSIFICEIFYRFSLSTYTRYFDFYEYLGKCHV